MRLLSRISIVVYALLWMGFGNDLHSQPSEVKKLSIDFSYYEGSYAETHVYVSFVRHNSILRLKKPSYGIKDLYIPDSIDSKSLRKLIHSVYNDRKEWEDFEDVFRITEDDYKEYMAGLENLEDNYDAFLLEHDGYNEKAFKALKFDDFIMPWEKYVILFNSQSKYWFDITPWFKIRIFDSEYNLIEIEPWSFFKGSPWICSFENKSFYLDSSIVMTFLKENKIDYIPFFEERFYMMFKIAGELVKEQK